MLTDNDNLVATFVFYSESTGKKTSPAIPSINEYYALANAAMRSRGRAGTYAAQLFIKKWRDIGYTVANQYYIGKLIGPVKLERAKVVVTVWWPNKRRRDIHNLFFKPLLDSFTDAGIWPDDSCIEEFTIKLGGIDKENPRVIFEIYSI